MNLQSEFQLLWSLFFKPIRGVDHQQRIESFYAGQAEIYDRSRQRMLMGRAELYRALPIRPGGVEQSTDGVVPYVSSHLDSAQYNVQSELLVRSDHGVQKDPEAIQEVLRILHLHASAAPLEAAPPRAALASPAGLK